MAKDACPGCAELKDTRSKACRNCFGTLNPPSGRPRNTPTRLENGCLVLPLSKGNKGYAKVHQTLAHRLAWEEFYETPIPEGMTVDHLCHNEAVIRGECEGGETCCHRACIEITHLGLADRVENWENGNQGAPAQRRALTHCPKNHSYEDQEQSAYYVEKGWRRCNICNAEKAAIRRSEKGGA